MKKLLPVILLVASNIASAQVGRDSISVVGSSTVYPFTTTVAENFGKSGKYKTPKVESTGTGGGIKLFCAGVGVQHPDAVNASRRIKQSELDTCKKNGINDVVEVKIGYDGLTVIAAKTNKLSALTRKEIYLALAKQIPNSKNEMITNPYKSWMEINPALPDVKIEVLGPPPTSGTRDSFVELFMDAGCTVTESDEKIKKTLCGAIREDGAFIEAGENDNLIVQKLQNNPAALGILGFSYLDNNRGKIKGMIIDGTAPAFDTIANGDYAPSRPLYIYVKKAHIGVIPGIKEFVDQYVSVKAIGEDGYLANKGLVPLSKKELAKTREDVKSLKNLSL